MSEIIVIRHTSRGFGRSRQHSIIIEDRIITPYSSSTVSSLICIRRYLKNTKSFKLGIFKILELHRALKDGYSGKLKLSNDLQLQINTRFLPAKRKT